MIRTLEPCPRDKAKPTQPAQGTAPPAHHRPRCPADPANPKVVRLYESHGLIAPPARTVSGYRTYQPEDLPVLRFIRQARALGLTRKEIKAVLDVRRNGRSPCALVACLLDRLLAETERRIAELRELRDALRAARALADPPAGDTLVNSGAEAICPIIEETALRQARHGTRCPAHSRRHRHRPHRAPDDRGWEIYPLGV